MGRTHKEDVRRELKDPEYAKFYGATDAKTEVAVALSRARHWAKKTQKELADAMGLSQPYIARLEGGDANPTVATVGSILAVLGFRLVAKTVPLIPEESSPNGSIVAAGASYSMLNNLHSMDAYSGGTRGPVAEAGMAGWGSVQRDLRQPVAGGIA